MHLIAKTISAEHDTILYFFLPLDIKKNSCLSLDLTSISVQAVLCKISERLTSRKVLPCLQFSSLRAFLDISDFAMINRLVSSSIRKEGISSF